MNTPLTDHRLRVLHAAPWVGAAAGAWFSHGVGLQMGGPFIAVVLAANGALMAGLLVEAALSHLLQRRRRR